MRRTEILGKEVKLNERDYRQLLKRFDPEQIRWNEGNRGFIRKVCICRPYQDCVRCPFDKFHSEWTAGCLSILHAILAKDELDIYLRREWIIIYGEEGKKDVQKVQDWLRNMKKIGETTIE